MYNGRAKRAVEHGDPSFISRVNELGSHQSQEHLADQRAVPGRAL